MDPDPGGPKIYGSYGSGSGSATLCPILLFDCSQLTCMFRNYGFGDTNIEQQMKPGRNMKSEYIMRVNKKEVSPLQISISGANPLNNSLKRLHWCVAERTSNHEES
jgi:hypothetical protein